MPSRRGLRSCEQNKWEYFHLIFKQEGEKVLASDAFRNFYEANKNGCNHMPSSATCVMPTNAQFPRVALHATYDAKR